MEIATKAKRIKKSAVRFAFNGLPTHLVNGSYNVYSKIYKGQINLGLPVAPELIISQENIKINAVGKLALTLYHIIYKITQIIIPRDKIKFILHDELGNDNIRLTEKVILLSQKELENILIERLEIEPGFVEKIYNEALNLKFENEDFINSTQPDFF
jgi:hypothetical protein